MLTHECIGAAAGQVCKWTQMDVRWDFEIENITVRQTTYLKRARRTMIVFQVKVEGCTFSAGDWIYDEQVTIHCAYIAWLFL